MPTEIVQSKLSGTINKASSIGTPYLGITPPDGYSVSLDAPSYNDETIDAVSFTWAGAEVSATYNYTIESSGGGTPVTGSGVITSADQQVSGIDCSGLAAGTMTLTAYLTDVDGVQGSDVTDNADILIIYIDYLVLYYRALDEAANVRAVDYSGYDNRGLISSGVGLSFATNDYISFGNQGSIKGVTFYIYLDSTTEPILDFNGAASIEVTSGVLSATGVTSPTFYVDGVATTSITSGAWHRVTMLTDTAITASAVNFGKISSSFLDGDLSFIAFLTDTITSSEELEWYNKPELYFPSTKDASLLASLYWTSEGAGSTCYDGSGNGLHATINGATWVTGLSGNMPQTALMSWNIVNNRLKYSEDLTNAAWTKFRATVVANAATDPIGNLTADFLKEDSTASGTHLANIQFIATSGAQQATVYIKPNGRNYVGLQFTGSEFPGTSVTVFDLSTGSVHTLGSGVTATIDASNNGYLKCTITSISTGAGTNNFQIYLADNSGNTSYSGDGASGVLCAFAGINDGYADGYIKTTSTAMTTSILLPEGLTSGKDILGINDISYTRITGSYNLNGSSYISVPDDASMDDSKSFSFWAKLKTTTQNLWEIVNGSSSIVATTGTLSASGITSPTIYVDDTATSTITSGVWKMITVTTATAKNVGAMKIGMVGSTGMVGQVAKHKIYTVELTSGQISQNYNSEQTLFP